MAVAGRDADGAITGGQGQSPELPSAQRLGSGQDVVLVDRRDASSEHGQHRAPGVGSGCQQRREARTAGRRGIGVEEEKVRQYEHEVAHFGYGTEAWPLMFCRRARHS